MAQLAISDSKTKNAMILLVNFLCYFALAFAAIYWLSEYPLRSFYVKILKIEDYMLAFRISFSALLAVAALLADKILFKQTGIKGLVIALCSGLGIGIISGLVTSLTVMSVQYQGEFIMGYNIILAQKLGVMAAIEGMFFAMFLTLLTGSFVVGAFLFLVVYAKNLFVWWLKARFSAKNLSNL